MGKKKHSKHNARKLAEDKKTVLPDACLSIGPIEIARFGKIGVIRNKLTSEQFERMQDKFVNSFPRVCQEIDQKILQIAEIVQQHSPEDILRRGYWELAGHYMKAQMDSKINTDDPLPLRMIDYIQSIIVSVRPSNSERREVTEAQWSKLKDLVYSLFSQLSVEYQICRTAFDRKNNPKYDDDFEEYHTKAQMHWYTVRGHRYSVHEIPYLYDLLLPHDEVLQELFSIGVVQLLESLKKIYNSLSMGIVKATNDLRKFQAATTPKLFSKIEELESIEEKDLPHIMEEVIKENSWEGWRDDVLGRFFGSDIFNLQKITALPEPLLQELSWEPGQDTEFFEGDYRGWPLKIWPVFKRPLIKISGNYYCFELHSLFDTLYRTLQRIVIDRKPEYVPIWNTKQNDVSESVPIKLFQKLLPSSLVYRSVYYQWHTGVNRGAQWCEADALLIYEDHLFIIEVKAGAFTYTPPSTDFQAYIKSLKNLILKPAEQGKRFLEYLNSANEVNIFDRNHVEVGKLRRDSFEHITICAITLDPFTELAAQIQHLKKIGIDVGEKPVWSISIDDLRVYADVFDNPLVFLHFVEQRMRAFRSELIQTDDELDHLGLYLTHNVYTEYVKDFNFDRPITWHGYREKIDNFFSERLNNQDAPCLLKQEIPTRLLEIIDFLTVSDKAGRRKVVSAFLDCGGSVRDIIASGIDETLKEQTLTRRAKPLSTYGGANTTVFCWQHGSITGDRKLAIEHVKSIMLMAEEKERLLLELTFNEAGLLVDTEFDFLTRENISPLEIDHLIEKAVILKQKRIEKARQNGKIGRNQPCPCGSGKKYKKCCLLITNVKNQTSNKEQS